MKSGQTFFKLSKNKSKFLSNFLTIHILRQFYKSTYVKIIFKSLSHLNLNINSLNVYNFAKLHKISQTVIQLYKIVKFWENKLQYSLNYVNLRQNFAKLRKSELNCCKICKFVEK